MSQGHVHLKYYPPCIKQVLATCMRFSVFGKFLIGPHALQMQL